MQASAVPQQNPEVEYQERLKKLQSSAEIYKTQDARFSFVRFALMFIGLVLGVWLIVGKTHSILWLGLPVVAFFVAAVWHSRVVEKLQYCRRASAFYERGLARLSGRWMGTGQSGERFLNAKHPYARDLDLFGAGSMFELLCTARTRAGEGTLAAWLLAAASPEEVTLRQGAIREMRALLRFREDVAVLSESVDAAGRPGALATWGEEKSTFGASYLRLLLGVLAALWVVGLIAWAAWDFWYGAAAMTLVNTVVARELRRRAEKSISTIEIAVKEVRLIARVIARIEGERFSAAKLVELQGKLQAQGIAASDALARLGRLSDSLASRRNLVVKIFDRFAFWTLQYTIAIEVWRKRFGPEVRGWMKALGAIEALSDLAGYAYEHPSDVFAELTQESPCYDAEGLAHPLIPESRAMRNDLKLGSELRLVIISGPNMAGKSTFVRAVGLNAVLAQCGAPVRAGRLRISALNVAASVCVLDSLQGGVSRFYAEITRLKLIMDMANGPVPVLFLLDELLSGTNSHDRRTGAEAIVRGLFQRNAIGLVTTHDLALAKIAEALGSYAANVHFEDRLENGELRFDYQLTPGIVQTSNALELMRSIGLEV
jgi:MutS domain V